MSVFRAESFVTTKIVAVLHIPQAGLLPGVCHGHTTDVNIVNIDVKVTGYRGASLSLCQSIITVTADIATFMGV